MKGTNSTPSLTGQSAAKAWLNALEMTASISTHSTRTFFVAIQELAEKFGDAPALLSEDAYFTYLHLAKRSTQYARWALDEGLCGKTVCLLMPNRPEYLAIWIGITGVGGVVSLLNTNLAGRSLAHCVSAVEPAHIIVANQLVDAFISATPYLTGRPKIWSWGDCRGNFDRLDLEVDKRSEARLEQNERPPVTIQDLALCIYTSGTTGLPKAAKINHYRILQWSYWFAGMMGTRSSDRMYDCLPMYHSVGGIVAIGAVLVNGGSVLLRDKFSARLFWDDVVKSRCTLIQYIGELCRYLLNAPHRPSELGHHVRLCCGNGLRSDVWAAFKQRFRIPQILEFYAATEGNVTLYNVEGIPGSIGRVPAFLEHRSPLALLKFDFETEQPIRNDQGFCIRCETGEVGEAIGRINNRHFGLMSNFEGYTNKDATEKKVLRNVFASGDAWFRTGDLMRKDTIGNFYFVDRIGDTFRWKGENVSTSEVADLASTYPGIAHATAYGVPIPGTDGRAGMVALVIDSSFDLGGFASHLKEKLPHYARPLFVRICREIDATSTFKHRKADLVRQGYDPTTVKDRLYYRDPKADLFRRIDRAAFGRLQTGKLRY